jgi:integrase/recombinase XerD
LNIATLSGLVREHVDRVAVGKRGSSHLFQHTMATLMLEGGADVRHVQEMLGHEHLTSAQIYTHVAIAQLKEAHAAGHPGAKLKPGKAGRSDDEAS